MVQLLSLALSLSVLWAQTPNDRFARYCDQLTAAAHSSQTLSANRKNDNLWAVIDATNGTNKLMQQAIARGMDYEQFKSTMAVRKITLNDSFHSPAYAVAAREKCETTESGAGSIGTAGHNLPTMEQYGRRVDDSGIGVSTSPGQDDSDTSR